MRESDAGFEEKKRSVAGKNALSNCGDAFLPGLIDPEKSSFFFNPCIRSNGPTDTGLDAAHTGRAVLQHQEYAFSPGENGILLVLRQERTERSRLGLGWSALWRRCDLESSGSVIISRATSRVPMTAALGMRQ